MSSSIRARAWSVAASVGVVEAMKDQLGICRWNYAFRSAQQHVKNHVGSFSQTMKLSSSSSSSAMVATAKLREEKAKRSEESLRTVMYLSSWGNKVIECHKGVGRIKDSSLPGGCIALEFSQMPMTLTPLIIFHV
ncbi:hypothetical protein Ahy_A03g015407 [Arachis hypogaea]|uniref:Wound-responsive family protein n=1 Tax=Arachis hypogaea TaxID=3818 RepID=A0A445E0H1_ARAHY|nr:hypothetical protein Ahy_A03g015407 [Arachis hypogaea]